MAAMSLDPAILRTIALRMLQREIRGLEIDEAEVDTGPARKRTAWHRLGHARALCPNT
jgi:hypothetical protein